MSQDFKCGACGAASGEPCEKNGEAAVGMTPPISNKYWNHVAATVCTTRWAAWKDMEIKIINEYRLNMLEKEHRDLLKRHMTDFLALDGHGGGAVPDAVAANWKPQG